MTQDKKNYLKLFLLRLYYAYKLSYKETDIFRMLSHFICSSLLLFLSDCFIIFLIQILGIFFRFVSRPFILYCYTEMGFFLSHWTSNWVSFYKIILVPATLLSFLIMCSSFPFDSFQFSRWYHMQIVFPLSFQFWFL